MLGGADVGYYVAFITGVMTFISPCILPMIPIYIMYLTGSMTSEEITSKRFATFMRSLGFVIGFMIVFMAMGLSASALGKVFARHRLFMLRLSGVVMVVFGLNMMGVFKFKSSYIPKLKAPKKIGGFFSSMLMGLAFGAGWTPCFGPILASIVMLASTAETAFKGTMLLFVYSLGIAVPFLLTGLFIGFFEKLLSKVQKYMKYVPIVSGLILVVFGMLILTGKLSSLI